jgi:hypothetical protein
MRYGQHIDLAAIAETASVHPEVITSAAAGGRTAIGPKHPRCIDPEITPISRLISGASPVPGAWPKWIVSLSALPLTAGGAIDHLALRRDAAARAAKEAQLVSQFAAALSCGQKCNLVFRSK